MTVERRKIVVTGASGNVGTGVLRALAAALPLAEVVRICRRPPAHGPAYKSVSWHRLHLSEAGAFENLGRAMHQADVVIHLVLTSGRQPTQTTSIG